MPPLPPDDAALPLPTPEHHVHLPLLPSAPAGLLGADTDDGPGPLRGLLRAIWGRLHLGHRLHPQPPHSALLHHSHH